VIDTCPADLVYDVSGFDEVGDHLDARMAGEGGNTRDDLFFC